MSFVARLSRNRHILRGHRFLISSDSYSVLVIGAAQEILCGWSGLNVFSGFNP